MQTNAEYFNIVFHLFTRLDFALKNIIAFFNGEINMLWLKSMICIFSENTNFNSTYKCCYFIETRNLSFSFDNSSEQLILMKNAYTRFGSLILSEYNNPVCFDNNGRDNVLAKRCVGGSVICT